MAFTMCKICEEGILTEGDPYLVYPRYDGYHAVCLRCVIKYADSSAVQTMIEISSAIPLSGGEHG